MTKEQVVEVMSESEFKKIHCIEKDGSEWNGTVDVYESAADNEYDEIPEASICVTRDEGYTVLIYSTDIESIEIVD